MESAVIVMLWALCGWACYSMAKSKTGIKSYMQF
jgi:hypothetical protein